MRPFDYDPFITHIFDHVSDGLREISKTEGLRGLYRGTLLALFGVSNGAVQFMAYEEMKRWAFGRKKRQYIKTGMEWTPEADRLVSTVLIPGIQYLALSSQIQRTQSCQVFRS